MPEGFFEDVLPSISSMLEMKVTLYLFWRLARGGSNGRSPRLVSMSELAEAVALRSALAQIKGPRSFEEALREGLELAVARGTLLQLWVRDEVASSGRSEPGEAQEAASEQWYLLNTQEGKQWVEALSKGEIDVASTPLIEMHTGSNGTNGTGATQNSKLKTQHSVRVVVERPSVYTLYEQNIGLLTPILAERLQEAEGRYPVEWIEAAFEEAVANNKRSWRYIERILERWAAEGKQSGKDRGPAERTLDPDKYTKGKYAFLFRPERSS